jgi:hypothetical protein
MPKTNRIRPSENAPLYDEFSLAGGILHGEGFPYDSDDDRVINATNYTVYIDTLSGLWYQKLDGEWPFVPFYPIDIKPTSRYIFERVPASGAQVIFNDTINTFDALQLGTGILDGAFQIEVDSGEFDLINNVAPAVVQFKRKTGLPPKVFNIAYDCDFLRQIPEFQMQIGFIKTVGGAPTLPYNLTQFETEDIGQGSNQIINLPSEYEGAANGITLNPDDHLTLVFGSPIYTTGVFIIDRCNISITETIV